MTHEHTTSPAVAVDWRELAVGLGELLSEHSAIDIDLGNGRLHQVVVVQSPDVLEISGLVGTQLDLERADLSPMDLWQLNAQRCLTSYVVEDDGEVWVTALAPTVGLTAEEFGWLVKLVAVEADRLEYRLTGEDTW